MTEDFDNDNESAALPLVHDGGNGIAFVALFVPVLAGSVLFFINSTFVAISIAASMVLVTAILMAVDASRLAPVDLKGRANKESTLSLFLAMCALWVIGFPYAFFQRQRFRGPRLGLLSIPVALYAGFGPLAYSLLVPPGLPSCTSSEVVTLLEQIVRTTPAGASMKSIDGHHEISFDKERSIRHGRCTLHSDTGKTELDYFVEWQDREKGMFQIRIPPAELPSCTSPEVIELLDTVIRNVNPGIEIDTIDGHRETSFDSESNSRQGTCDVHFDSKVEKIHYVVKWVDRANGSFSVQTVQPPEI